MSEQPPCGCGGQLAAAAVPHAAETVRTIMPLLPELLFTESHDQSLAEEFDWQIFIRRDKDGDANPE
ncbi:MAG: hypothetical protein KF832_31110 [Caldilineaceae bacterium]|nr:hypothetical protein [Caldilineaceae bacterium]